MFRNKEKWILKLKGDILAWNELGKAGRSDKIDISGRSIEASGIVKSTSNPQSRGTAPAGKLQDFGFTTNVEELGKEAQSRPLKIRHTFKMGSGSSKPAPAPTSQVWTAYALSIPTSNHI